MPTPRVTIWSEAPKLALPESPSLLVDSRSILLAYETAGTKKDTYAVVRFTDVIDHRLSPINDEGLGKHAYAKFGLEWYSFNEVSDSKEVLEWAALRARHWVVTFKDVTLDVLAAEASVVARDLSATSPLAALLSVISPNEKRG